MAHAAIATVTIKTHMPSGVARFWRDLLGYRVASNHSNSVLLVSDDGPSLLVQPSVEPVEPGAFHLDLRPADQASCVARAIELGARHITIGQTGEEGWVVLADPGGTPFCVLQSRADYLRALAENPGTPTPIE